MSDQPKFGGISFDGKDIGIAEVPFDKLAISGRGELLLLSIFTDQMRVKAIRAVLCGGAKATANAGGVKVNRAGDEAWRAHTPGRLSPTCDGYFVYTHKLGFGLAHALFITKMPGFMKVVTTESLWQELNSARFTTPLLREWTPKIEEALRKTDRLENAFTFNCNCGILSATTDSLDEIVSVGIEGEILDIPYLSIVRHDSPSVVVSVA